MHTRFPPEPNGYLHIGHAKSICLNFGTAAKYGGTCNLRFDDTNPTTEDVEYVDSIAEDVRWLGFEWNGEALYASDYFEKIYECAEHLIRRGQGLRRRPDGRADQRVPRQLLQAGQGQPLPQSLGGREPGSVPPHARGRVRRRLARAARQDRHAAPEPEHARSAALPHQEGDPPPHRRRVVHLPDVRLRPPHLRRARGDHALDLHAGVRGPPAALRLVHRRTCRCPTSRGRSSSRA